MYIKNGLPKNQKKLKANTQNYIDNLQKNTQKVANSFQHQSLRYASWFSDYLLGGSEKGID